MTVSRSRASERRAKRILSSGGEALRVIRAVNLGEMKREGEESQAGMRESARELDPARVKRDRVIQ